MSDIDIRVTGRAGRITLNRPKALNALTHEMCLALETALRNWREDDAVDLVIIDAAGDKAFCAGGDIAHLYATGKAGDYGYGRGFWRDEYRLNAYMSAYPKPIVSFMQGFVMGGGVGIGCHCSHRILGETTQFSMPECGIGLVPDVGGTLLFAKAPGALGTYLALTGARMRAAGAIHAGFGDFYIDTARWSDLIEMLEASGDVDFVAKHAQTPPDSALQGLQSEIDRCFGFDTVPEIADALAATDADWAQSALKAMRRSSPLAMACALGLQHIVPREEMTIRTALELEFRFVWRSMEHSDFLEGVRAQIIDKDRNPTWKHDSLNVDPEDVRAMLVPLGADEMTFEEDVA